MTAIIWVSLYELVSSWLCKASYTNWGFLVFGEQHFRTCPGYICMCDWLLAKIFFPGRVLYMLMARNCNCNRGFKSVGWRPDFDDRFMYFQNEIHAKGYVNVSCMMCFYMSLIVWIVSWCKACLHQPRFLSLWGAAAFLNLSRLHLHVWLITWQGFFTGRVWYAYG